MFRHGCCTPFGSFTDVFWITFELKRTIAILWGNVIAVDDLESENVSKMKWADSLKWRRIQPVGFSPGKDQNPHL